MRLTFEVWPNMPWGRNPVAGPAWNSWGDKPLQWCARKLAEYGYDGLDIIYPKLLDLTAQEYRKLVTELETLLPKLGMVVGYIGCHTTFVSPREADRRRGIDTFKKAIDMAADLRASSVCTLLGDGYYDPPLNILMSRKQAWQQAVDATREVAEYAKAKGLNVSIELLQGTIVNRIELLLKLFEEVAMDNVRATVDLGTFYTTVKPFMPIPEALKRIAKYIDVLHVKDEVGLPTITQSNHIWFGGGLVDFREVARTLKEINFQGFASVEWEGWQVGGSMGVGEPAGIGLADMDRVAVEAREFLLDQGFTCRNKPRSGLAG